jgi:hypothetical protein
VLQEAELVYYSVQASERKAEELQHTTQPAKTTVLANARGLPQYPRNARQVAAPVQELEHGHYDPHLGGIAQSGADVEHDLVDWDYGDGGESVEQVLLAHVVQPQRIRYCYTCWKPGYFSAECPLIPDSERAAIALRGAEVLKLRQSRITHPQQPYSSSYKSRPPPESERFPKTVADCRSVRGKVAETFPENVQPAEEQTRPPRSH